MAGFNISWARIKHDCETLLIVAGICVFMCGFKLLLGLLWELIIQMQYLDLLKQYLTLKKFSSNLHGIIIY